VQEPQELVSKHVRFSPLHISFLEKIDDDISVANRKALDMQIKRQKNNIGKPLFLFVFGLVFIFFGSMLHLLAWSATAYGTGAVFIILSVVFALNERKA